MLITLLTVLSQAYFWQLKEYRADRMRVFLFSREGSLTQWPFYLAGVAAILFGWIAYLSSPLEGEVPANAGGGVAVALFFLHHAWRIFNRGLLRPIFTAKAAAIIFLSLILAAVLALMLYVPGQLVLLQWATLGFFLPGLAAAAVALVNAPFALYKLRVVRAARRLRESLPGLTVIGITGSYGKTTTKHLLEHVLKTADRKVAATLEHHNTPIGVAQDMLSQLTPETEFFVAELSAYKRGEIRQLADLVKPTVGIVTAIGNQHLALFGSRDNIRKAKLELIDALPQDGVALVEPADPVLAAARALGIQDAVIDSALASAPSLPRTMEMETGLAGATIIDDSYSANEAGVLRALDKLAALPQPDKRVVILPLIELGPETEEVHQRIEAKAAAVGAKLYWVTVSNARRLLPQITQGLGPNSAVLLENRIPDMVRKALLHA